MCNTVLLTDSKFLQIHSAEKAAIAVASPVHVHVMSMSCRPAPHQRSNRSTCARLYKGYARHAVVKQCDCGHAQYVVVCDIYC